MNQVILTNVTLPGDNSKKSAVIEYPTKALRQSSSYFNAMLGGRWLEGTCGDGRRKDDEKSGSLAVDLSQSGLNPQACSSLLRFMLARYSPDEADAEDDSFRDATQQQQEVDVTSEKEIEHKQVKLEEIKILLWEGFQWDEEEMTLDWRGIEKDEEHQPLKHQSLKSQKHSDEVALFQAIDFLHIQPHDEIINKLLAMKLAYCPCYLEGALIKEDYIGYRGDGGDEEYAEMYIMSIPGRKNPEKYMWRFLVCMFICRIVYGEDDDEERSNPDGIMNVQEIRALNHQRQLEAYDIVNQLTYLCSGLGEEPVQLLQEMVGSGLLKTTSSGPFYQQTSLDSQVMLIWNFLDRKR